MKKTNYSPQEVAQMLGVHKEFLLACEREGTIPPSHRDEKNNRFYPAEEIEKIRQIVGVRKALTVAPVVLAVFNMKGGVGKSTVAANLAWTISQRGYRTLGLDADPQGHMTTSLGEEPASFKLTLQDLVIPRYQGGFSTVAEVRHEITPNLHLIPANLSMCSMNLLLFQQPEREYRLRRAMDDIRREGIYDLVIVDSPPSYDLTSLNIVLACSILLAPVKLDGNSFYGLQYLFGSIDDLQQTYRFEIPLVAIVASHYNHSFSVSRQIMDGLRENYGKFMTRTIIRQDVNFDKANALREPISVLSPSSKGARDMESLAVEMIDTIEHKYGGEQQNVQG
jgi:chromosome partitioning protein